MYSLYSSQTVTDLTPVVNTAFLSDEKSSCNILSYNWRQEDMSSSKLLRTKHSTQMEKHNFQADTAYKASSVYVMTSYGCDFLLKESNRRVSPARFYLSY